MSSPIYPLFLATAIFLAAPVRATEPVPRDELLNLVPADTAVCFVIQGLREQAKAVADSPFAAWAGERLKPALGNSPELAKLRAIEGLFPALLGVTAAELRDDILGDAIVLAYQPGPPGKPDAEQGAVMLKARDPAKLRKLIDRLNDAQKAAGELTDLTSRSHRGRDYVQRVKADGKSEFYLLRGGLFVFAGQESAIQAVIDREAGATTAAPVAAALDRLGVKDSFLVCWFNPRRLDADLRTQLDAAGNEKERAFRRQFAKLWSAVDDLAVHLDVRKSLELGVATAFRPDALPPELKPLLAPAPTRSALWQVIPDDALAAAAGRVNVPQLLDAVESFLPADERPAFRKDIEQAVGAVVGKDKLPAVLSAVGPDWGMWVTRPRDGWLATWTAAVRVRDDADPSMPVTVLRAAGFYAQMLQFHHNRSHDEQITFGEDRSAAPEVKYLASEKLFPPGFRPAVGLKDGYLVFGSTPAVVRAFASPPRSESATDGVPFLRVSATTIREYLMEHRGPLAKWVAAAQGREEEQVAKELQTVADLLEAFDRVDLAVRGDGQKVRFGLRVTFVKPLAK